MSWEVSAPSQTHPFLSAKAAELCSWGCHPASPPVLTLLSLWSQLLDCDYGVLFCSLYLILSAYFIADFHLWYFGLWDSFILRIREVTSALHMHELNLGGFGLLFCLLPFFLRTCDCQENPLKQRF